MVAQRPEILPQFRLREELVCERQFAAQAVLSSTSHSREKIGMLLPNSRFFCRRPGTSPHKWVWIFGACICLAVSGCGDSSQRNLLLCDVGTATFERPLGWDAQKTEWPTLMLLTPADVPRDLMTRMISIDAARPEQKSADLTAVDFAMRFKGILLPAPTELDGELAHWVIANGELGKFQPTHVVIAHHKGQAYYILGGSSDRSDLTADVEAIIKSWKWKK